jgi:hypothetical protein
MFYGGMAGAVIALVAAILVYVKLNIAQVITDLTGRNFPGAGRKALKRQSRGANTSDKPITREINVRKNVEKEVAAGEAVEPTERMVSGAIEPTALLSEDSFESTALLNGGQRDGAAATALLSPVRTSTMLLADEPAETTILSDWSETTVLTADPDETTLLDDWAETTLLTEEEPRFKKQVDIVIVHSNTTI